MLHRAASQPGGWLLLPLPAALQVPNSPVTESTALGLLGLQDCEALDEPSTDTHAVLGWGPGSSTIVLAFRGTVSLRNAWTDLKASVAATVLVPCSCLCLLLLLPGAACHLHCCGGLM